MAGRSVVERACPMACARRYNVLVIVPGKSDELQKQHRHATYTSETTGLLVIAFLVLVLTVIRYWHNIHWSWR